MTKKIQRRSLIALAAAPLLVATVVCADAPPAKVPVATKARRLFSTLIVDVNAVPKDLRHAGQAITVLDSRSAVTFVAGHIRSARRITWEETSRSGLREGRLKPTAALAELMSDHGVSNSRPVLVCGDGRDGWGEEGRIAWVLLYLGHPDVAVLDGGCAAWGAAGRATAIGPVFGGAEGRFVPVVHPQWRIERDDLKSAIKRSRPPAVLDVRTREEYDGATPYFSARGGHIDGARHLPLTALYDDAGHVLKPAALKQRLSALGVHSDAPVALYCTGGVRSAMAALILHQAGYQAMNYDGSWWDWSADKTAPISK